MAAPVARMEDAPRLRDRTLRLIVHSTVGGDRVRVRLSNLFGKGPVEIGGAHIALRDEGAQIVPASDRALSFQGVAAVTIPPGGAVVSDPVALAVPAFRDLAVSLHLKTNEAPTVHDIATQDVYVARGDRLGAAALRDPDTLKSWPVLTGIDVMAPAETIVAIGDSITDGVGSGVGNKSRWTDVLAKRLLARSNAKPLAVLNAGIGGNRILRAGIGPSALDRFPADVLERPGVRYVILLEGINDIGMPGTGYPLSEMPAAQDLIAGMRRLIDMAHGRGLKIFGATLLPFEGTIFKGYYSDAKEQVRQAVNDWIRTGGGFDGVIDFDRAVRDPARPSRLLPAYATGDNLHPNDAGYAAMGNAVDLSLFD